MEVNITGRNLGITDRFREYATEKAEKVAHLAEKALVLEIKLSRHSSATGSSGDDRVELTLIGPGPLVRAESSASDKYAAFDLALAKLHERVRRAKDRKKVHRGKHRPTSLREAANGGFSVIDITPASVEALAGQDVSVEDASAAVESDVDGYEGYSPVVIRHKLFPTIPMTLDDALYQMELVGHDFYLFVDSETDRASVVYRRKGWDYGVIRLESEEEAAASERVAAE